MTPDRTPDDEDDQAWLLARERGEPGPTLSDDRASRYAQLGTLIKDLPALPAGTVRRTDWEQGVLAVIDADVGPPADRSAPPPAAMPARPLPQRPAATRIRRRAAAAAVFTMVAGVAIVVVLQREHGKTPVGETPVAVRPEVTRGMHVERGRLGVDPAVQVRASHTAAFRELRDGDTVTTGDAIRASVTTSTDAYLYLAFCADQRVQMYPSQRGVRTAAGQRMVVPEGGGELVLDSQPGSEVLYLIVSQDELSVADPALAALLVASGDGTRPVTCDASLDTRLGTPADSPSSNVLRGETVPRKDRPPAPGVAGNPGDAVWYTTDGASRPGAVVGADANGIAVVRYRFRHAPSEPIDHH
jgi:hypothetical protein